MAGAVALVQAGQQVLPGQEDAATGLRLRSWKALADTGVSKASMEAEAQNAAGQAEAESSEPLTPDDKAQRNFRLRA